MFLLHMSAIAASCAQEDGSAYDMDANQLRYADPEEQVEDACDATDAQWALFCGELPSQTGAICNKDRGQAYSACLREGKRGECWDGCDEFDRRWNTYCNERIPAQYKLRCISLRLLGHAACGLVCRKRSVASALSQAL
jgi:hypothetical protein